MEAAPTSARSRPRSTPPTQAEKEDPRYCKVRVVCRLRPMDQREKKADTQPAVTANTQRKEVAVARSLAGGTRLARSMFHFDHVLGSFSTQQEVFASTLRPLVDQVLEGYEGTAFAYGPTGTGKTYTMEGSTDSEERRGLMPRAAAAVLGALADKDVYCDSQVTVSYLEVYNEELSDLLAPAGSSTKLDLMESGDSRGVCCQGLSEVPVSSVEEVLRLVQHAQDKRRVAETRVHARSSRSHCIFTMKVRCRKRVSVGELENVGRLHLVDLAGSECAKKAAFDNEDGAARAGAGEQERERRNINQSLLTLGRVIAALREKSLRVPYRDSKLTRLLKDALGGNCKTVLIATISPALSAAEETISTLTYAEQASGIQNRPVVSSLLKTMRMGPGHELRGVTAEGSGVGATEWAELEMKLVYLTQEVEEAQAALARTHQAAQADKERAERAERELGGLREELAQARSALAASEAAREQLASTARAVADDLQAADGEVAAARERLAAELEELRAQRAGEERLVAALRRQRCALHEDVAAAQAALGGARQELAAAEAASASVVQEQARSRERALQAILACATAELGKLGEDLQTCQGDLQVKLNQADSFTSDVATAIAAAEERSSGATEAAEVVAAEWAAAVGGACDGLTEHCSEALQVAQARTRAATRQLAELSEPPHRGLTRSASAPMQLTPAKDSAKENDALQQATSTPVISTRVRAGSADRAKLEGKSGKRKIERSALKCLN